MLNIITVCYNTADFISFMHQSVESTINFPFNFYIVDNGSKADQVEVLKKLKDNKNVHLIDRIQFNNSPRFASRNHAEAIHFGIEYFGLQENIVHVDCDCFFILKDWGNKIFSYLNSFDHVSCVKFWKPDDCSAHFMSFSKKYLITNNISLMPKLLKGGRDNRRANGYDTGSGLAQAGGSWKKIYLEENIPIDSRHIGIFRDDLIAQKWTIDGEDFFYHLGASSYYEEQVLEKYTVWSDWLSKRKNIL